MRFSRGRFYSPVPDKGELKKRASVIWNAESMALPGIDLNDASHVDILANIFPRFMPDYRYPERGAGDGRVTDFYTQNSQFSWLDSRALFVLLREWRPRRIIEVGSGYSSLLIADVNNRFLDGAARVTCIEPYPRPFLMKGVTGIAELMQVKAQDAPSSIFQELGPGDVLFIDSSHVSKIGSDVNTLFLKVIPLLRAGVRVHVHDIFLPYDYPQEWVLKMGRHWNEQYLLQALLCRKSDVFRVLFGCYYAHLKFPELVSKALARETGKGYGGASFWFEIAS